MMNTKNVIETRDLTKIYKRYVKKEGIGGSIASLFRREYVEKEAVSHMDLPDILHIVRCQKDGCLFFLIDLL